MNDKMNRGIRINASGGFVILKPTEIAAFLEYNGFSESKIKKALSGINLKLESTELEEAKLEKPKGSPLEVQNKLGTMIAKAKTIKGISDDEYMSWYSNLDSKTYEKWQKMVKADPQYKKAYKLGTQGGSDKPPFPKGSLAAAIWSNEYAAGAMDS